MGCIFSNSKIDRAKPTATPPRKTELQRLESHGEPPQDGDNIGATNEGAACAHEPDPFLEETLDNAEKLSVSKIILESGAADQKYELVIAIDFGTTYSGYAYAYTDDPTQIHINQNWAEETGAGHFKTPTYLCVQKEKKKFHSFGYEAKKCYLDAEYEVGLKLFEKFKMDLYKYEFVDRNLELASRDGFTMKAMDIFAMAITYLKDHCTTTVKNAGRLPEADKIRWVLTVPAIWSDTQKMFMREAAIQAGLISDVNDENLVIALEPESASLVCRSVPIDQGEQEARKMNTVPDGSHFMIVDAGGGTIDITVYEALQKGTSREIYQPSGGSWAGNRVNENFVVDVLRKFLGIDFIDHCREECPSALFEIIQCFENAKKLFKDDEDHSVSFPIPLLFAERFEDYKKQKLKDYFEEKKFGDVKVTQRMQLQITQDVMKSLFDPVVDNIINHMKGLLTLQDPDLSNVKTIFLVGGFSQCTYLQQKIKHTFVKSRNVIIPESPVLAVLKGAVMYGCRPDLIHSRISPRTYSILAYRGTNTDQSYLSKIIEKGSSVEQGHVETCYAEPNILYGTSVHMDLYASDDQFSEDTNDPNTYKVGSVEVPCPVRETLKLVEFKFIFGGTEIKVEGQDTKTGQKRKTVINFLGGRNIPF